MDTDRFLTWQNIERYKNVSDIVTDQTQRRLIVGLLSEELKTSKQSAARKHARSVVVTAKIRRPGEVTSGAAIALAPVEDFRRDSNLFGEGARNPEVQSRLQAALKRGFQTREAEMDLARLLG